MLSFLLSVWFKGLSGTYVRVFVQRVGTTSVQHWRGRWLARAHRGTDLTVWMCWSGNREPVFRHVSLKRVSQRPVVCDPVDCRLVGSLLTAGTVTQITASCRCAVEVVPSPRRWDQGDRFTRVVVCALDTERFTRWVNDSLDKKLTRGLPLCF